MNTTKLYSISLKFKDVETRPSLCDGLLRTSPQGGYFGRNKMKEKKKLMWIYFFPKRKLEL